MAFGPVLGEYGDLVNVIVGTVEGGFVMGGVYQHRADDFFKFKDKNNRKCMLEGLLRIDEYY